jgi:hypothetical protein
MFLFEDRDDGNHGPNETRTLVQPRIVKGSTIHVADARLLECHERDWDGNAIKYWQDGATAFPLREVLVDGTVYFPRWQTEPFGLMRPDR